jgi:hypothetical protein
VKYSSKSLNLNMWNIVVCTSYAVTQKNKYLLGGVIHGHPASIQWYRTPCALMVLELCLNLSQLCFPGLETSRNNYIHPCYPGTVPSRKEITSCKLGRQLIGEPVNEWWSCVFHRVTEQWHDCYNVLCAFSGNQKRTAITSLKFGHP